MPSPLQLGKLCILCMYLAIELIITPYNAPRNDYRVLVDRLYWQWCISALETIVGGCVGCACLYACIKRHSRGIWCLPYLTPYGGGIGCKTIVPVH
jgi:hypothetical protein